MALVRNQPPARHRAALLNANPIDTQASVPAVGAVLGVQCTVRLPTPRTERVVRAKADRGRCNVATHGPPTTERPPPGRWAGSASPVGLPLSSAVLGSQAGPVSGGGATRAARARGGMPTRRSGGGSEAGRGPGAGGGTGPGPGPGSPIGDGGRRRSESDRDVAARRPPRGVACCDEVY